MVEKFRGLGNYIKIRENWIWWQVVVWDKFVKSDSAQDYASLSISWEDDFENVRLSLSQEKILQILNAWVKLDNGLFCLDKGSEGGFRWWRYVV